MLIEENNKDFILQIKDKLSELTVRQILYFSWLCSVRAFPLLGVSEAIEVMTGNLKNYLYIILNSLDITCAVIDSERRVTATDAATISIISDDIDSKYGDDTRLAVRAISYAVYAAYIVSTGDTNTESAISSIVDVAANAASNADAAAKYSMIDMTDILFDDIRCIKSNDCSFYCDTSLYGPIWDYFQDELLEHCGEYWCKLYSDLFMNRFEINHDALQRRINIPPEIQEHGAKVVGLYLEKLDMHGSERLDEARIIILGEKGAGKSCLARRLVNIDAPMTDKEESTEGIDTSVWKISDSTGISNVNVHIWDFAGHVITHAAHRCFLSERCLYIIVYDGRTEERNRLNYWLDHVRNYGNNAPVRILINIFDSHKQDIPTNTLKEKYPNIYDFVYFSISSDKEELREFRNKTSELIRNNPLWNSLEIPTTYYMVKEALESRFQKENEGFHNEQISKEFFDSIAKKNNIDETNAEQLLRDLHKLGICLWYEDIEGFNALVLNPDWLSHGIYKLINWAHNNSKHTIHMDDYESIYKNETERYSSDKLLFIFRLMKKYELAYSKVTDDAITVPFLLKEDQPESLPDFSVEDSLLIQYVSEQPLPPNTVSRLIVRHNEEIKGGSEVWRHGVVLTYKNNTVALVKEDDRKVIIKAKGNNRGEYIIKLRDTMNDIFNSYKGDKPELQYKIITSEPIANYSPGKEESKSLLLSDETIKNYMANGRPSYYYPQANIEIPLDQTVNIYNINAENAAFGPNSQIYSNNFNFYNCNLTIQGELKSLINSLSSSGYANEAKDLELVMSDLEAVENIENKKEVIKSGGLTKTKNFLEDISNEKSSMRKVIAGVKYGVETVQSIAKTYNSIAQWIGLPQVPKPFLGG